MVGKNIGHGGFMIEIKNIVKTLSPERNPSTRLKTDNSRLFEFWQRSYNYLLAISGKTNY